MFRITPSTSGDSEAQKITRTLEDLKKEFGNKENVMLYFYFSGHSDQLGRLICSSNQDLIAWEDINKRLASLPNISEMIIILDCCYADNKHASGLLSKGSLVTKAAEDSSHPPSPSLWVYKSMVEEEVNENHTAEEPLVAKSGCEVVKKAPQRPRIEPPSVWQWLSSTRYQQSLARTGGHSFFTEFMLQGFCSGHGCGCTGCKQFQVTAEPIGYISAASLEDHISQHVNRAVREEGRDQNPLFRTVHSRDIPLAYYNRDELSDNVLFTFEDGQSEFIKIPAFPESLTEFQEHVYSVVKGN